MGIASNVDVEKQRDAWALGRPVISSAYRCGQLMSKRLLETQDRTRKLINAHQSAMGSRTMPLAPMLHAEANGREPRDYRRRATDGGRRTADIGRRTTDNGRRTTDDGQRVPDAGQRTGYGRQ